MLKVIDLKNNPYPAQAQVKRKQIVNGEQQLSLSFFVSEMNIDFLPDLSYQWLAEFDQEQYTIINPSIEAITKGKSITAILKFFTDFGSMYLQDEVEDKSMTALNAYTELFSNTGKRVHLVDNFYSNTLSYQKNQSRLERFHYYNTRFKAEFIVRGDDVYLYNKIGSYKPDVRIDEDLNVKSATVEIDSENFFTWCKCYFDLEQNDEGSSEENYRQEYVYVNNELYAIYGDKEGPALYQGNIKSEATMKEFARDKQQESVKISHSVDLVDLQKQGYGEFIFNIGDTVRLSLSSIDITVDIRIVEKDETWVENQYGEWERTDLTLTLGNVSAVQSYKNSRSDSMLTLQDWIDGRKPIPQSLLEPAIQRAADIVLGDTDSVMEYRKDRLTGHHSKNEGNNVTLNVSGLVFYRNGVPTTGATYEGIIADAITAGTINTHNVTIMGVSEAGDVITMDGSVFKVWNINNPEKYVEISKGEIHIYKGGFRLTGKDTREIFADGLMRGGRVANILPFHSGGYLGRDSSAKIIFNGMNWEWNGDDGYQRVHYIDDQYHGRFMDFRVAVGISWDSPVTSARIKVNITTFDGTVVGSGDYFVHIDDENMRWETVRVDLQAIYGVVPDYRTVGLYAGVEVSVNKTAKGLFRINRGEFNG